MKAIIQRVSFCNTHIQSNEYSSIGKGLLVLVGIGHEDGKEDMLWICKKICHMRIFEDHTNKMNLSIIDVQGEIMLISQFTLFASTRKGNRPSFLEAANPEIANKIFEQLFNEFDQILSGKVKKGIFGSEMHLHLINYGPVTIMLDSKEKL